MKKFDLIIIGGGAAAFAAANRANLLKKKPKSVIILGGGPQGMEFSQIFHRFGIKVTVPQRSGRILTKHDPLIAEELRKHLEEGIKILTNAESKKVKKTSSGVELLAIVKGKPQMFSAAMAVLMLVGILFPK